MPFERGPFVIAAALCDQALQDKDGVISLIRVVDKVASTDGNEAEPGQMPPFLVTLTLVLMLKAGEAAGQRFTVKFRPVDPAGVTIAESEMPVQFPAAASSGVSLLVKLGLIVTREGVYWIDVLLDDELLTRTPLQVDYQPLSRGSKEPAPG